MLKNILFIPILIINLITLVNASSTISTCTTINSSYVFDTDRKILLDSDILNDDGTCMVIKQSNFILDCQGNTIQGDSDTSGSGFSFGTGGGTNITIKNCNIERFNYGFTRSVVINNVNITNNSISHNRNSGFYGNTAGQIYINNNYFNNNSINGIHMRSGWQNSIIENNIFNNTPTCYWLYDNGPRYNIIRNNVFNNCDRGIYFARYARYNDVYNNIFTNNVIDIYLHFSSGSGPYENNIYNNTLNSSKVSGASIDLSYFNLSTTGNIWLDYNGSIPFCFGSPNVCDNHPSAYTISIPETPTITQTTTRLPSISTYSIITSIIFILAFTFL
jgi:parallel beta-helix repeat protein